MYQIIARCHGEYGNDDEVVKEFTSYKQAKSEFDEMAAYDLEDALGLVQVGEDGSIIDIEWKERSEGL